MTEQTDYEKLQRIVTSCRTPDQTLIAGRCVHLYAMKHYGCLLSLRYQELQRTLTARQRYMFHALADYHAWRAEQ